jgi:uncharacterized membrane protein
MGQLIHNLTAGIALGLELAAALIIAAGAVQVVVHALLNALRSRGSDGLRNARHIWMGFAIWLMLGLDIWMGFAIWLMLGLELTLASDIVHTALAPSWTSIGQLAAIAAIRTVLGRFLTRDIRDVRANMLSHPRPPT